MIKCTAGYICDSKLLGAPSTICPKGYICIENVGTNSITMP
jgi:hypothetical protein